jgi:hypothetical protein
VEELHQDPEHQVREILEDLLLPSPASLGTGGLAAAAVQAAAADLDHPATLHHIVRVELVENL